MNTGKTKRIHSVSLRAQLAWAMTIVFTFFFVIMLTTITMTYTRDVEKIYINQVVSTSEQALNNYTTYMTGVLNISDVMQRKLDGKSKEEVQSTSQSFLDEVKLITDGVESVALYDHNGNLVVSDTMYTETLPPEKIAEQSWFVSAYNNKLINSFSRVDNASEFTLSKVIRLKNEDTAVLKVVYDFTGLTSMIDEVSLGKGGHVVIYDNNYDIVYASAEVDENEIKNIQDTVLGVSTYKKNRNEYFMYISTIPYTRWRAAIVTNIDELYAAQKRMTILSAGLAIVVITIIIILIYVISNNLTSPLVRLQREMAAVENLDFKIKNDSQIRGTLEIQALNKTFDSMMNRIHDLAEKVVEEQKEQNKAELKALQNQINPHFLYNTLDSIIYLIDENRNEEAQNMIIALSRFFRISISRGRNVITVRDELDHVRYYLQIQKMRYGPQFHFNFDVQPGVENYYVIKLILQPLVENAIIHGLSEKPDKDANILIRAFTEGDFFRFDITDNGFGMLPEKIEEIYASFRDKTIHNGVGLSNVYHRLRIFYGDKADIKIESALDVGTKISIYIPLEEVKTNEEH